MHMYTFMLVQKNAYTFISYISAPTKHTSHIQDYRNVIIKTYSLIRS